MYFVFSIIIAVISVFHSLINKFYIGRVGSKFTGIDLVIFFLLFLCFANTLVKKEKVVLLEKRLTTKLLFLLIILSLPSLFNGLLEYGYVAFGEYKIIFYSIFYFITINMLKTNHEIKSFINIFLFSTILLVIISIWNLNEIYSSFHGKFNYFSSPLRNDGTLLMSLIPLFIISRYQTIKLGKYNFVIIVFYLIVIFISQTRSVIICLLISSMLFILLFVKLKRLLKTTFIILSIIITSYYIYITYTPDDVIQINMVRYMFLKNYLDDPNSLFRYNAWKEAIRIIISNPIFGESFGSYVNFSVNGIEYYRFDPHNTYLYIGAKIGIIGLIVFILILFSSINRIYYKIIKSQDENEFRTYYIFLFLSITSFAVFIAFNASLKDDSAGIFLWIILAISNTISSALPKKVDEL